MRKLFSLIIFFSITLVGFSQSPNRLFNPYSQHGIGGLKSDFYARNFGIANIGIANYDKYSANMLNPALLEKNKYTILDANLGFTSTSVAPDSNLNYLYNNEIATNDISIKSIAVVLPVSYKWTTAFGLNPISNFANVSSGSSDIIGDTSLVLNNTEFVTGSMQRASWSNGFKVMDGLNLGFGVGYNFGNKVVKNDTKLNSSYSRTISNTNTSKISGFDYELGAAYSYKLALKNNSDVDQTKRVTVYKLGEKEIKNIGKLTAEELSNLDTIIRKVGKSNRKFRIDIGAVYTGNLEWKKTDYRTSDFTTNGLEYYRTYTDTVTGGSVQMPSGVGFGITIGNISDTATWKLSLETTMKNWSEFKEDGNSLFKSNVARYAVGFEFTPNKNAYEGFKSNFVRATYRIGAYQSSTPYVVNNNQLDEVGIHFGIGFIERQKRALNKSYRWINQDSQEKMKNERYYLSRLNFGFAVGKMGMNEATAIEQMFFKFNVGFSLNNEWFVRRKIN